MEEYVHRSILSWLQHISSVTRQKGESQNRYFKKTKHTKFSKKRTFLTLWYAHTCTYQGVRNVRFLGNLECFFFFLKHPFWNSLCYVITNDLECNINWRKIYLKILNFEKEETNAISCVHHFTNHYGTIPLISKYIMPATCNTWKVYMLKLGNWFPKFCFLQSLKALIRILF